MAVPDFQTLMLPLLRFARDAKEHSVGEARSAIASEFKLTSDELAQMLPSGRAPLFANRLAWAKQYLSAAGLLDTSKRAHFVITSDGADLLKGRAIVAAFEVESTTSINSGLLRMADLVSMQPNISLPLYLVAPDERRDKVFAEVNRPTFAALQPPLAEICRYIGFVTLREEIKKVEHVLQYLKPEFLEELSESCELGGE